MVEQLAIEARGLVKRFGVPALGGVDLRLPVGGVLWQALAWIGALLAVTVPTAVVRYRAHHGVVNRPPVPPDSRTVRS